MKVYINDGRIVLKNWFLKLFGLHEKPINSIFIRKSTIEDDYYEGVVLEIKTHFRFKDDEKRSKIIIPQERIGDLINALKEFE